MFNFNANDDIRKLELLLLIRKSELLLADKASVQEFKTPIHLGIGQEAIAVGISENLKKTDFIFGNHRSHAHYLSVGGSLFELFAEILGKSTGCSGGKGGSMHITSPSNGFVGSMPIVAGTIPIALGAALSAKIAGKGDIAVSYFGDGAVEEGVFHESLNLASVMGLPILFVCENNLFSSHLHISERQPDQNISRFANANKIATVQVDGNEVDKISLSSKAMIEQIRRSGKPGFIEAFTYRFYGHVGYEQDENVGLNRKIDLQNWRHKDPITLYKNKLIKSKSISESGYLEIENSIENFTNKCWNEAKNSTYPEADQLVRNVYFEAIK